MDDELTDNYKGVFDGKVGFGDAPAILVIDFVRAYADQIQGSKFYSRAVDSAVSESVELIALARRKNVRVIYTTMSYQPSGFDGGMFVRKVPAALTFKPGDTDIDRRIAPQNDDLVMIKQYASAFFGSTLAATLTAARIDTVIILGCSTSGCVRASTVDCISHGFRPIIPRECVGDRHMAPHEANLFDINAKYGDVLSKAEVMTYLGRLSGSAETALTAAE